MSINTIAFKTLVNKEVARFMRIWSQTLVPPAITMTLYFLIFGKFIGGQLQSIHGHTYMQYIVPGLVLMSIMTNAYANTASSFFITKFNKSIEEMLVAPMSVIVILLGYSIGGALRGLLVGIIVLFIGYLFTHLPFEHPFVIISMALLSAMVFSLAGLINGIYARRFDDISFIPTFILTPLTYLGGVFYSISQLPPIWQKISYVNPIFSMIDTFRFGLLGMSDINIYLGFAWIIFLLVSLFLWGWWLLVRGIGIKV